MQSSPTINRNQNERKQMNKTTKWLVASVIVNVMLALLVWSQSDQLHQSRSNERELSRHLYEVGKYGKVNR